MTLSDALWDTILILLDMDPNTVSPPRELFSQIKKGIIMQTDMKVCPNIKYTNET